MISIEQINSKTLCVGCGMCAVVCPQKSIKMSATRNGMYRPIATLDCIKGCHKCVDICPGYSMDLNVCRDLFFSGEFFNIYIGNHRKCYVGYSEKHNIRLKSSSGGVVTSLLIHAIDSGIIDGALVTRMNPLDPLRPEVMVAKTKEELIAASGSKYCPVEISRGLEYILANDGKYAVVGLPCQINAIRKAEVKNKDLRDKIVLHLGIFCSHNVSFHGTEVLLKKLKVNISNVGHLDYRTNGWPGEMQVTLKHGSPISKSRYWGMLFDQFFFTPIRCTLCPDMTSELADISFGDAWLPEYKNDKSGMSILISRNSIGDELLNPALENNTINLKEISKDDVINSQVQLLYKKRGINARIRLMKLFNKPVPIYDTPLEKASSIDYLVGLISYFNIFIASTQIGSFLLVKTPSQILKLYGTLIYGLRFINREIRNLYKV